MFQVFGGVRANEIRFFRLPPKTGISFLHWPQIRNVFGCHRKAPTHYFRRPKALLTRHSLGLTPPITLRSNRPIICICCPVRHAIGRQRGRMLCVNNQRRMTNECVWYSGESGRMSYECEWYSLESGRMSYECSRYSGESGRMTTE